MRGHVAKSEALVKSNGWQCLKEWSWKNGQNTTLVGVWSWKHQQWYAMPLMP